MKYLDSDSCQSVIDVIKDYTKQKNLEAYPVGTILFSADKSYDPNKVIGGTWGTYYPADSDGNVDETGGWYIRMLSSGNNAYVDSFMNADSWHKLTVNNLPAHTHTAAVKAPSGEDYFRAGGTSSVKVNGSLTYTTSSAGTSNNKAMHFEPPYFACDVWTRTA